MLRVSILSVSVLLLQIPTVQAQTARTIGSGTQPAPIVTPISTPTTTTASPTQPRAISTASPVTNPMPITSALAKGCDSGCSTGCSTDCSASACGASACCDCCPNRTLRAFGGWNLLENMDTTVGVTALTQAELDFNPGFATGGAIGKYITCNLRRELEFTYRQNSPNAMIIGTTPNNNIDGVIRAYSVMGNLVYEAPQLRIGRFQPYVGSGIGVGVIDANIFFASDAYTIDDTAVAYQGFVGFQREVGANAKFFAEYRMFGTDKVDVVSPGTTTRENYVAHNVFFGIQIDR